MKTFKKQLAKSTMACLVILSLFLQLFPAPQPAQAAFDIGAWLGKLTQKIALPEVILNEQGDLKIGSWVVKLVNPLNGEITELNCLKKDKDGNCVNPFSQFSLKSVIGKDMTSQKDLIEPAAIPGCIEKIIGEACKDKGSVTEKIKCAAEQQAKLKEIPPQCVNPKKGELAMPEPYLPKICEIGIPLPGDLGCTANDKKCESKILAKNKACIYLNRLQESASQEVFLANKIFNSTDPFSDCLFFKNCRTNCSLRLGEVSLTVSLLDVAALFIPGGFLAIAQKILNIAKLINDVWNIITSIKDLLNEGVNFVNNIFNVMGQMSSLFDSFTNLGLKWSDVLIYGGGALASNYLGDKIGDAKIGPDPSTGKVGWLQKVANTGIDSADWALTAGDGLLGGVAATAVLNTDRATQASESMQDLLGNFAQNNLSFNSAKKEALTLNAKIKGDVEKMRTDFKQESEISFFFDPNPENLKKKALNTMLGDFQLVFRSVDEFLSDISKTAQLGNGTNIADVNIGGEQSQEQKDLCAELGVDCPETLQPFYCTTTLPNRNIDFDFSGYVNTKGSSNYGFCYLPDSIQVSGGAAGSCRNDSWLYNFVESTNAAQTWKNTFELLDSDYIAKKVTGCAKSVCLDEVCLSTDAKRGECGINNINCYREGGNCVISKDNLSWRLFWEQDLGKILGTYENIKNAYIYCRTNESCKISPRFGVLASALKDLSTTRNDRNAGKLNTIDEALSFSQVNVKYKNLFEYISDSTNNSVPDTMGGKHDYFLTKMVAIFPSLENVKNLDILYGGEFSWGGKLEDGVIVDSTRRKIKSALQSLRDGIKKDIMFFTLGLNQIKENILFLDNCVENLYTAPSPLYSAPYPFKTPDDLLDSVQYWKNVYFGCDLDVFVDPGTGIKKETWCPGGVAAYQSNSYNANVGYEAWGEKIKILRSYAKNDFEKIEDVKNALSLGVSPEDPIVAYKIAQINNSLENIKATAGKIETTDDWIKIANQIIDAIIYGTPKEGFPEAKCSKVDCPETGCVNLDLALDSKVVDCSKDGCVNEGLFSNSKVDLIANCAGGIYQTQVFPSRPAYLSYVNCCRYEDGDTDGHSCCNLGTNCGTGATDGVSLCKKCLDCECDVSDGGVECGDNKVEGDEECDDGNKVDGDGCSSTCTIENLDQKYQCSGPPQYACQPNDGGDYTTSNCDNDCGAMFDCVFGACVKVGGFIGFRGDKTCGVADGGVGCGGTPAVCPNGVAEGSEECDGSDKKGENCISQGYEGGNLSCNDDCTFNTDDCDSEDDCTNDCSPSGRKECLSGNLTLYQTCGNYDADACLEWSTSYDNCPPGQVCSSGACVAEPEPGGDYECRNLSYIWSWVGTHWCKCKKDFMSDVECSLLPENMSGCHDNKADCVDTLGFLNSNQKFVKVPQVYVQKNRVETKSAIPFAANIFANVRQRVESFTKSLIKIPEVFAATTWYWKSKPYATQAACEKVCQADQKITCNLPGGACALKTCFETHGSDKNDPDYVDGFNAFVAGKKQIDYFDDPAVREDLGKAIAAAAENLQNASLALGGKFKELEENWKASLDLFSSENQESATARAQIKKILMLRQNSEEIVNDIVPTVIEKRDIAIIAYKALKDIVAKAPKGVDVSKIENIINAFDDGAGNGAIPTLNGVLDFISANIGPQGIGHSKDNDYGCEPSSKQFLYRLKCFEEINDRTFDQLLTFMDVLFSIENVSYGLDQTSQNIQAIEPSIDMNPIGVKPTLVDEVGQKICCCQGDTAKKACEALKGKSYCDSAKCDEKTTIYSGQRTGENSYETLKSNILANPLSTLEDRFEAVRFTFNDYINPQLDNAFGTLGNSNGLIRSDDVFGGDKIRIDKYQKPAAVVIKEKNSLWRDLIWGNAISEKVIKACDAVGQILANNPEDISIQCINRTKPDKNGVFINTDLLSEINPEYDKLKADCSQLDSIDTDILENLQQDPNYIDKKIIALENQRTNIAPSSGLTVKCPIQFCINPTSTTWGAGTNKVDPFCIKVTEIYCQKTPDPILGAILCDKDSSAADYLKDGERDISANIVWDTDSNIIVTVPLSEVSDGAKQWPPNNKQSWEGARNLCISTQEDIRNLKDFKKMLENLGGAEALESLTTKCNRLDYQESYKQDCHKFDILTKVFNGKSLSDVTDAEKDTAQNAIKQFCEITQGDGKVITKVFKGEEAKYPEFGCTVFGNNVGIDMTGLKYDNEDDKIKAKEARDLASKLCSQSVSDMRTPLNEIMKVFSVLLGVKSYTAAKNGFQNLYFDGQKLRKRAEDSVKLIEQTIKKFQDLISGEGEDTPIGKITKGDIKVQPVKCIQGPMISYAGSVGAGKTGPKGGQVCPNVSNQFNQLDAMFSLVRQNLRMIDLARRSPSVTFGFFEGEDDQDRLNITLPNSAGYVDDNLNELVQPIYDRAKEIKEKSQLLWALATAINYANENCTCGQSYCPQLGPVPLCISGLPLTTHPLKEPFCHLVWTMRYPLGSLAEKLKQDLEAIPTAE